MKTWRRAGIASQILTVTLDVGLWLSSCAACFVPSTC